MNKNTRPKSLLIIGAGGIGTTVVDLLVPALVRIQLNVKITLIDGDIIEASNLGHQNYGPKDIGKHKVDALARKWLDFEKDLSEANYLSKTDLNDNLLREDLTKWRKKQSRIENKIETDILQERVIENIVRERPTDEESLRSISNIGKKRSKNYGEQIIEIVLKNKNPDIWSPNLLDNSHNLEVFENEKRSFERKIEIISQPENVRHSDQLEGYDFVVVCVDRPEPRRLVHSLDVPWIDLRCSADGWMILSSDSDAALVEQMTPDHEPMSCQVEGALDAGNLEFGFSVAGTFGAQWLVQNLRGRSGPVQSMGSLTYGGFEFPQIKKNSLEVKA